MRILVRRIVMGMTEYIVTRRIVETQGRLAEIILNAIRERNLEMASALITLNEKGAMTGVFDTSSDGNITVENLPSAMHMPLIELRVAMRLPDTDETFSQLSIVVNREGDVTVEVTYDRDEQPNWVMARS